VTVSNHKKVNTPRQNDIGGGSLEDGIERLLDHYKAMVDLEDRHHVICLVLHCLKHNASNNNYDINSDDDSENQVDYECCWTHAKTQIRTAAVQYIHVSSSLDVQVDGEQIVFAYWQCRMVELTLVSNED